METGAVADGGETRRPETPLAPKEEEEEAEGTQTLRSEDEETTPPALTKGLPTNSGLNPAEREDVDLAAGSTSEVTPGAPGRAGEEEEEDVVEREAAIPE